MNVVMVFSAIVMGLWSASVGAEATLQPASNQIAQSDSEIVYFRTADLHIAFAPKAFSFFAFEEYKKFGVRAAAVRMQEWSGVRVKEANLSPNMIVLRGRGFDSIIESDDPLVRSVLNQFFFGAEGYQEKARRLIGPEQDCFFLNAVSSHGRILSTVVFLNSRLSKSDEAICFVRSLAGAFGAVDLVLLNKEITISTDTGRITLGDDLKQAFSGIYVF
ncbi:MAG: hypothetical protein HOF99_12680 [Rhodospirillaceae bacterium]|nr:hypothetical protein [Rhodospirillaceae bacterium]